MSFRRVRASVLCVVLKLQRDDDDSGDDFTEKTIFDNKSQFSNSRTRRGTND